jgi:glucose/arabinose dehydrogenase
VVSLRAHWRLPSLTDWFRFGSSGTAIHGRAFVGPRAGGSQALLRISFRTDGQPDEAERWQMDNRIRDVAVASDGAVWIIEDADPGRLLRLTPAQ